MTGPRMQASDVLAVDTVPDGCPKITLVGKAPTVSQVFDGKSISASVVLVVAFRQTSWLSMGLVCCVLGRCNVQLPR